MTQDNMNPELGQFRKAKHRLASHPDTSPEVLDKLADGDSTELLERVAENEQTTPDTLEKLSTHATQEVRSAVTDNVNTPDSALRSLAADEHPDVRYRLAGNPQTPVDVLETLTDDDNPYVVARAQDTLSAVKSVATRADEAFMSGKFAAAEDLYRKLISGLEELLGKEHLEVAAALHKLAATLISQDNHSEAAIIEQRSELITKAHNESKKLG